MNLSMNLTPLVIITIFVSILFDILFINVDSVDSNFIIDEFDEIYLPFGMTQCQHHSPIGTYVEYECGEGASDTVVWKQYWEDVICPGNWTDRSMVNDTDAAASKLTTASVAITSDADSLFCDGDDNTVTVSSYCDFEVPAQRDLVLATDVCVDVMNSSEVYMYLTCETSKDSAIAYFWSDGNDCSSGFDEAYSRELNNDECLLWLGSNETGLGYEIYAQTSSCDVENMGISLYSVSKVSLIVITMFGWLFQ